MHFLKIQKNYLSNGEYNLFNNNQLMIRINDKITSHLDNSVSLLAVTWRIDYTRIIRNIYKKDDQ